MNGTAVLTHVFERPLRAFRQDPQLLVTTVVGVVIAYLSLSPTIMLFYGSFLSKPLGVPGDFTLAHYIRAYTDPLTYQLLFNSFVFAAGASILATFLAATLAWISIRTNAPFRKFFEIIAIVPNIFPPVMLAVSWTVLLSPRTGLINRLLMNAFDLATAPHKRLLAGRDDVCRSFDHDTFGFSYRIGIALFHGSGIGRVCAGSRFEQFASGLADYFSDCSAGAAGFGDAQLCSCHRKF